MILDPNERNASNPLFIFGSSPVRPFKMSSGNYPLAFRCIFCKEEFSMYIEYRGTRSVSYCPFCGRKGLREADY
jgi:transcription elongation factor Elf1